MPSSSNRRVGTLSCSESIAARKAEKALDRDIKHNPQCPKGQADQRFARNRGRSCTKSSSNQKRHRSASLSPPMHRTSSHRHHDEHHTEEDTSHQRKRSKSVPSQKKEAANDKDHSDTTNGVEDKEKRWDEVPVLVLTGAGFFPTLA